MLGIFGPLLIRFCEACALSAADALRTTRLLLCGLVALLLCLRRLILARHLWLCDEGTGCWAAPSSILQKKERVFLFFFGGFSSCLLLFGFCLVCGRLRLGLLGGLLRLVSLLLGSLRRLESRELLSRHCRQLGCTLCSRSGLLLSRHRLAAALLA